MEKEEKTNFEPIDRRLIAAMLVAAGGWALHLNLSYILTPESCDNESKLMLHLITVASLLLTLGAAAYAWKIRSHSISETEPEAWRERATWSATFVVVLALSMSLVVIAQEIPNLILRSCD